MHLVHGVYKGLSEKRSIVEEAVRRIKEYELGIRMTLKESVLEEEGMHVFEWWGGEYRPLDEMDEVKKNGKGD